ncbi:hypothetical protein M0802_010384 [Mischocyttarus mexicanus]|nr:hypothetical protein M0802_010384 [Mischocyttarus mexicanus]
MITDKAPFASGNRGGRLQFAWMNQREAAATAAAAAVAAAGRLLASMMRSDTFMFARERREDTLKPVDGNIGRVTLRGLHRTVPVGCRHISHSMGLRNTVLSDWF